MAQDNMYGEKAQLVMGALAAIGPQPAKQGIDATCFRVCKTLAGAAADLTRRDSPAMRMLGAERIYAQITSVDFEASSSRFVIGFAPILAGGYLGEEQAVRTDRTDGFWGSMVRGMLKDGDPSFLVGRRAFIFKTNDEMSGKAGRSIRVAPFISIL